MLFLVLFQFDEPMEVTSIGETEENVFEFEKEEEPLLMENPRRFVLFPIEHTDIWQFYKKAEGQFSRHLASGFSLAMNSPL